MQTLALIALGGLILCAAMSGSAQAPAVSTKTTYLLVYRPGPGWIAGKPYTEQPLKEHGKYMLGLYVKGTLKSAGPFLDNAGGAVVFEAENESEATAIVAGDPAVIAQVFAAELHPWRLLDWEQYIKK
jgi:uncharacterized protein YciI